MAKTRHSQGCNNTTAKATVVAQGPEPALHAHSGSELALPLAPPGHRQRSRDGATQGGVAAMRAPAALDAGRGRGPGPQHHVQPRLQRRLEQQQRPTTKPSHALLVRRKLHAHVSPLTLTVSALSRRHGTCLEVAVRHVHVEAGLPHSRHCTRSALPANTQRTRLPPLHPAPAAHARWAPR